VRLSPPHSRMMMLLPRFWKVDTVAWAIVDSEFTDSLTYRLYIPGIPIGKAVKA
jgi:hypothetical protein